MLSVCASLASGNLEIGFRSVAAAVWEADTLFLSKTLPILFLEVLGWQVLELLPLSVYGCLSFWYLHRLVDGDKFVAQAAVDSDAHLFFQRCGPGGWIAVDLFLRTQSPKLRCVLRHESKTKL